MLDQMYGAWSTLLLCKTEVGIAVVSWLWVSNSLGDAIQEYVSLVEVWAMLKGLDVLLWLEGLK